ncbi:putative hydroxymethylpyrimidine transport system permease protein [Pleomorphomonas diazotrophica]|nr:ABC transporter permease [Pleomorphomonas diazotrophica]SFN04369.1 putative hydroxymethylpyrimidine transport system permease protein [Pleomorphomonas diazotrophica]
MQPKTMLASGLAMGRGVALQALVSFAAVLVLWQAAATGLALPSFLLPSPADVVAAYGAYGPRLLTEAGVTLAETMLGLAAGIAFGLLAGFAVSASPLAGRLLSPLLVVSQALPVFALAPLLVLWFGFGLASKVVMTTLVIFFPVASAFADGLRRTPPHFLDLARLNGAGRLRTLRLIRVPAALPALVTGIRVAAVYAPIGAVIGEWVGASRGLGLLMVQANARMQTPLLFAALGVLAAATLLLKIAVDRLTLRLIPWIEKD